MPIVAVAPMNNSEIEIHGQKMARYLPTDAHKELADVLNHAAARQGGFSRLAEALLIELPWTPKSLERRKLKRLADADLDTALTFSELNALDDFLKREGYPSLSRLFQSVSLLEAVAKQGRVKLFLGFKHDEGDAASARTWISHWDMRSVSELLQSFYRHPLPGSFKVDIVEVSLLEQMDKVKIRKQAWHKLLEASIADRESVIAIGTPKACLATEAVLAKMFQIPAFGTKKRVGGMPFRFEWSLEQLARTPSHFAYATHEKQQGVAANFSSFALEFNGRVYRVQLNEDEWNDYGVIVAQRRSDGGFSVVCAGLSGPGTLAAAKLASDWTNDLSTRDWDEQPGTLLCRAVEARIRRRKIPGDTRELESQQFIGEIIRWPSNC